MAGHHHRETTVKSNANISNQNANQKGYRTYLVGEEETEVCLVIWVLEHLSNQLQHWGDTWRTQRVNYSKTKMTTFTIITSHSHEKGKFEEEKSENQFSVPKGQLLLLPSDWGPLKAPQIKQNCLLRCINCGTIVMILL